MKIKNIFTFFICWSALQYCCDTSFQKSSACDLRELGISFQEQNSFESTDFVQYLKSNTRRLKDADIEAWRKYCMEETQNMKQLRKKENSEKK